MAAHRPRRLDIDDTQKANIAQVIQQLPGKGCSLRGLIADIRDDIQQAMERGYSYREMALILHDQGIQIAPRTLRLYLKAGKVQAKSGAKSRHSGGKAGAQAGAKAGAQLGAKPGLFTGTAVAASRPQNIDQSAQLPAITVGDFTEISDIL
jgi:hypothetical protein